VTSCWKGKIMDMTPGLPAILQSVFGHAIERDASDIHLMPGLVPLVRVNGRLVHAPVGPLSTGDMELLLGQLVSPDAREKLRLEKNLDTALTVPWGAEGERRFRTNFFHATGLVGACLRLIPPAIPSMEWAGFPANLAERLASIRDGLVIFTGPTGSGKSTSLAMLVDRINREGGNRILTVEEPVEYRFSRCEDSLVTQREVGTDVLTFADGLKYGLRQDPDIILVGEVRDRETAQMALSAAETGHLVLTTLHTRDAKGAVSRYADLFPQDLQKDIRSQLALGLRVVVAQRLLPDAGSGGKRHLALEVLWNTNPIASGIRQGKLESLDNYLLTGKEEGMVSFDESIRQLLRAGKISREVAERNVREPSMLAR